MVFICPGRVHACWCKIVQRIENKIFKPKIDLIINVSEAGGFKTQCVCFQFPPSRYGFFSRINVVKKES